MNIVYVNGNGQSIFLAGGTPRDANTPSWRPEAIRLLRDKGFTGSVFVPEQTDGQWKNNYDDQVEWELKHLELATIIMFWVPRDLDRLPCFTTNVEFGIYLKSGKIVYGRPEYSHKNKYLDHVYLKYTFNTIALTLDELVDMALVRLTKLK